MGAPLPALHIIRVKNQIASVSQAIPLFKAYCHMILLKGISRQPPIGVLMRLISLDRVLGQLPGASI